MTIVSGNNSKLKTFFTTARKKAVIKGSFQPDIEGASVLFKDHFYLPGGKGLMGYPVSAYDRYRAHYYGAVAQYENGDITGAMNRLGKALHYLSDINEPHHSSGVAATDIGGRHTAYENWVESHYSSYKVSSMTTSALSAYTGKSLLTIADASANYSRGYISEAKSSTVSKMQTATNATLKRAQKDAAGIMYKFAKEVGII